MIDIELQDYTIKKDKTKTIHGLLVRKVRTPNSDALNIKISNLKNKLIKRK